MTRPALRTSILFITLLGGAPALGEPSTSLAVPFAEGAPLADGWRVASIERHGEYARLHCASPAQGQTVVEIARGDGSPGEWSTGRLRVQPAPGAEPPEELLRAVVQALRDADAETGVPGQGPVVAVYGIVETACAALGGLLAALLVAAGLVRARRRPSERFALGVLGLVLVGSLVALVAWVGPLDLPLGLVTVVHEGLGRDQITHLAGRAPHAGPNHAFLVWALAPAAPASLPDMARLALIATMIGAIGFFALARRVTGSWLAALGMGLLWALHPVARHAALSESPGPLVGIYVLAGAAFFGLLDDRDPARRAARWGDLVGLAGLAAGTALLALTRLETAGFGLVALGTGAVRVGVSPERLEALGAGLRARLCGPRTWSRRGILLSLGLGAASLPLLFVPGTPGWVMDGLHPLQPSVLALPLLLLGTLPLGVALLALAGLAWGVRHPLRAAGLALSAIVLFKVYFTASHLVFFEIARYATKLMPALLVLSLFGLRAIRDLWPGAPRALPWILALLSCVPPLQGARELVWDAGPGTWPLVAPLERDRQIEARFLIETTRAAPACVLVGRFSRGMRNGFRDPDHEFIAFGGPLSEPLAEPERPGDADPTARILARVDARLGARAPCVRYWRGLDCNTDGDDPCAQDHAGLEAARERFFERRTYNDDYEYGAMRRRCDLGVYRLREPTDTSTGSRPSSAAP